MKFAIKFGIVTAPRTPVDDTLLLLYMITGQLEVYVYDLGGFLLDTIVGEINSGGVVDLYGSGGLEMAHFFETDVKREGVTYHEEGGGNLGYRGGAHIV